ncbi:antitoxin of toxin-antitoxin stability system [Xaviernesmea oryzae]|uniref:Antitoxin of toxin-antitoxin stability system n=1 Tax=Xaviernesmea oryzae TaxID=464029 RepID=A0A1Q9AU89_9HYPH|nr:antitoxin of toxin-antitoxin stability system [Xaviernesmea oryzae]OLP58938.1 antitoxin of toxin-antitoxin stability system [Xaviernesmea oryzae]
MPEIVETTVYRIDELDASAREKAREWFRQVGFDHEWYEFVYSDFETICTILGITLCAVPIRLFGGGTRTKPGIWFSGFWSQGDGACFEGSYAYAKRAASAIRAHAPRDTELHAIADALQAVQRRNFYQLRAGIRHQDRYYHEYTMAIAVERDSPNGQAMTADAEDIVIEALRDLARWLYRRLEDEYEYQTSDAEIDAALEANAYTFTADGHRFG